MREVICGFVLGALSGGLATVLALRFLRWLAERSRAGGIDDGWSMD